MQIGEHLRNIRHEKGLTLEELSKESGVAMATLCRIEKNKMKGSLKSHINICRVLGITLPELYSTTKATTTKDKTSAAETYSYLGNENASLEILSSDIENRRMLPTLIKIRPGFSTAKQQTRPGVEKLIYVISGQVEISVDGKVFNLAKGDNFYLSASRPHLFKNNGAQDASLLCIASPSV